MSNSNLIESGLSFFDAFYKADLASNVLKDIDNHYIEQTILKIKQICLNDLTDEEIKVIMTKITALYYVFQPEGVAILNDYLHIDSWYDRENSLNEYFWDRYKYHLLKRCKISPKVVDILENDTLKNLMSYIGNPHAEECFSRKGLVIGDVQSGKTSNYIGLMCKAASVGYKVFFLLTGTIEALRQQTQIRIEDGFIGYDTVNNTPVGVGRSDIVPFAFTTRKNDFVKGSEGSTAFLFESASERPYVFVIKKNVTILKKVYNAIKRNLDKNNNKIKFPMIMIDDECDNASINTNDKNIDTTQTNAQIRNILALFEKSNYIGFTATPFANVFIDPNTDNEMLQNDLFPKDFIYALFSPSNYNSAKKMFVDKGDNSDRHMLEYIDKSDDAIEELKILFPLNHNKNWSGVSLPMTAYEAIDRFLLTNAIRDLIDDNKESHRSMLINMSRFTAVHFNIAKIVQTHVQNTRNDIKQSWKLSQSEYLKNKSVSRLYDLFQKDYSKLGYDWRDIFNLLLSAIECIDVITVNSSKESSKLNYTEHKKGYRVIAIGGMALSRGLTLEGLMISYFYRNSSTFDVLMQMGRWFGYRENYASLCKVYITKTSEAYYREIVESTEQLKKDMVKMCNLKQRPTEFGIRVRNNFFNNLRITASNKMRTTRQIIVNKDFWGEIFYTPFLDYGAGNIHNLNLTKALVENCADKIDKSVRHPYWRGVGKNVILDFLKSLNVDADRNDNFDAKQLITFIDLIDKDFDILLMGGNENKIQFTNSVYIKPVQRQYELVEGTKFIRINRHRLGGSRDTQHGLKKDQIERIEKENESINSKNYLTEDRNPLLIIYLVVPSNFLNSRQFNEDSFIDDSVSLKDEVKISKELEFEIKLSKEDYHYLIGYQIAFPKCDQTNGDAHIYVTNINADYYKLHDNMFNDDGGDD
ncbi:MAG: Z1 domain-containing protein [Christensenellaceae bacterium]|nr:Z1 domain-containing protein [Christensenellaceae bacterium]